VSDFWNRIIISYQEESTRQAGPVMQKIYSPDLEVYSQMPGTSGFFKPADRSMSITVILQLHETTKSLFPTQKQNTTWTHFSVGYTDIKDATTVPAFVSSINTFYAY